MYSLKSLWNFWRTIFSLAWLTTLFAFSWDEIVDSFSRRTYFAFRFCASSYSNCSTGLSLESCLDFFWISGWKGVFDLVIEFVMLSVTLDDAIVFSLFNLLTGAGLPLGGFCTEAVSLVLLLSLCSLCWRILFDLSLTYELYWWVDIYCFKNSSDLSAAFCRLSSSNLA